MEMGAERHAPAAVNQEKSRYQLHKRLGGPQGQSRWVRKISQHQESISGPSSPHEVAIPIQLSQSTVGSVTNTKLPTFRQTISKFYLLQGRTLLRCCLSKYLTLHNGVSINLRVCRLCLSYSDAEFKKITVINIDA
jgi:hypothetical protein